MKVLREGEFSPQHTDVVFMNRQSATERDMTKTIGRFNQSTAEIAFLEDKGGLGTKYRALFNSSFALALESVNGALYVSDINDAMSVSEGLNEHANDFESMGALNENIDTVVYVSFADFYHSLNESATDGVLDLDFTHKDLDHTYVVGHVATDGNFTLRPEIANLISTDFTIVQNHSDEPSFDVDLTTLSAGEVVNIIKFLRKTDLNESVQVDALAEVTKLLSNLRISKRHGDGDKVKETVGELNAILDSYKDANPPAKGVEFVRNEIKKITKDRDIVTESLSWLNKNGL